MLLGQWSGIQLNKQNEFTIDKNGWWSAYATGDLVIVNDRHYGIVLDRAYSNQETLFPFIKVYLLEDNTTYDYGINSLEIVSKA